MKRRGLRLGDGHRLIFYAASVVLFLSGATWAWVSQLDDAGRASETLRRAKPWLITVHGLSAMLFVLLFGTLLFEHVARAWHARKNRRNGAFFLSAVSLLTLSGYALYYMGNESSRAAMSRVHLWLGIGAPLFLFWHIRGGRKSVGVSAAERDPETDRRRTGRPRLEETGRRPTLPGASKRAR